MKYKRMKNFWADLIGWILLIAIFVVIYPLTEIGIQIENFINWAGKSLRGFNEWMKK